MSKPKTKVAVVGATGYTGLALLELLLGHKQVEIQTITSESYIGRKFSEIYPAFTGLLDLVCVEPSLIQLQKSDLVFFATPNGIAHKLAPALIKSGTRVIDLSADYRLRQLKTYEKVYGFKRNIEADRKLNSRSIYALAEFRRKEIATSTGVIANPGCYTTASILALTPLLEASVIARAGSSLRGAQSATKQSIKLDLDSIIIDAKSGVSGAGRKAITEQLYAEINENIAPYKLAGQHRHIPELEAFWSETLKRDITITFSPHLVPMTRGLLVTCYVRAKSPTTINTLRKIYQQTYDKEPFVTLLEPGVYPQTKWVVGTNRTLIQIDFDKRNNQIIITAVIDNLIKGAAGQALQNMNIIMGYPETMGLELAPQLP